MNFLNPSWLFFGIPLAAALLALYLRKGKNIRKTVSSIFFIKQLPSYSASSRRRLFLPPRAILELILLSLLLLIIAGLGFKDKSEQITIIVDNSLSMLARSEASNLRSESLLERAKQEAISNINYFTNLSKVSVWLTSPKSVNITNGFVDSEQAVSKIKSIQAAYAEENLDLIVHSQPGKKLIFTDLVSDSQQADGQQAGDYQLVDLGVIKAAKENVALESIRHDKISNKVLINVKSYLLKPLQCQLNIYSNKNNSDWTSLNTSKLNLTGISTVEVSIDYELSTNPDSAVKAKLESCNRVEANALTADDQVWLSFQSSTNKFYLVSSFSVKDLKLDLLDNYQFTHLTPEQWRQSPKSDSPVIFHRYLPQSLPDSSAIFIYPTESKDWLPSENKAERVTLVDWDRLNPVLRYLNFPKLSLEDVKIFSNLPGWSQSFLKSSAGDLGIIGTNNSKKYIALGFEILPFSGKQNLAISILTLNMLEYLFSPDSKSNVKSFNFENEIKDYSVIESAVPIEDLNISADRKSLIVHSPALLKLKFKDNQQRYQATQQFLDSESNLLNLKALNLSNKKDINSPENQDSVSLEKWLLFAIIILTLIDLILTLYRKNSAR